MRKELHPIRKELTPMRKSFHKEPEESGLPTNKESEVTEPSAYNHSHKLLRSIWPDKDWSSEHMGKTPVRFVHMLQQLTQREEFEFTTFESDSEQMVVLKDITFHSLCAHHIVPFIGRAHVGYIPQGRLVGLSKIPRAVRYFAADLTVQEELTRDIAEFLEEKLNAKGVAVVMEAEHMCATLRGVKAPGMQTITSEMRGVFADHSRLARAEFLQFIK